MADRTDYFAEGYHFATEEDAKQAQLERKKAAYFESKLVNRNAQSMLSVYDTILDEKVFLTPTGWEYLKKLQEKLRHLGIPEEEIRPIPMYVTFVHNDEEETAVRQRVKPTKKKEKQRDKFRISIFINVVLALLVAAMFAISLNSSNPNILNYKKNIENEYAAWEQELTQREKEIRIKEAQLENGTQAEPTEE